MAQHVEIFKYGGEGIRALGTKNVVRLIQVIIVIFIVIISKKRLLSCFIGYVKNNRRVTSCT